MPHYSAKGKKEEGTLNEDGEVSLRSVRVHGQKLLDRRARAEEQEAERARHYLAIARIPSNAKFPANVIEFPPGTLRAHNSNVRKGRDKRGIPALLSSGERISRGFTGPGRRGQEKNRIERERERERERTIHEGCGRDTKGCFLRRLDPTEMSFAIRGAQ